MMRTNIAVADRFAIRECCGCSPDQLYCVRPAFDKRQRRFIFLHTVSEFGLKLRTICRTAETKFPLFIYSKNADAKPRLRFQTASKICQV